MKLTIERAALMKALAHVQSVVERRNTIPILANVLIEADGGHVRLTATDMDLAIVEAVEAKIAKPGATTAPAHTLYDIVRKLPEGSEIEVEAGSGGQLTIRTGRAKFSLATLPKDEFPLTNDGDMPVTFDLPAAELRTIVDRTRFAISTEETRYYLNGIYLHAAESEGVKVLRAVATDGHRLARFEMALPEGATSMPGVIVPRKMVAELRKLADDTSGTVTLSLSPTRIRLAFDNLVLSSKLIDGTFPDYERVIPAGNDKIMEVSCRDFAQAVDRVATIATEKSRAVKLSVASRTLTLSASSNENGTASEELEALYDKDPIEIGFNARYLLDIAQQIEGDRAQFAMADAASPTIVRDAADASALYVLMPMRV
ncbi:MAG: DNA polymerase III subunit beta [Alphaproteobacteria bacterium]